MLEAGSARGSASAQSLGSRWEAATPNVGLQTVDQPPVQRAGLRTTSRSQRPLHRQQRAVAFQDRVLTRRIYGSDVQSEMARGQVRSSQLAVQRTSCPVRVLDALRRPRGPVPYQVHHVVGCRRDAPPAFQSVLDASPTRRRTSPGERSCGVDGNLASGEALERDSRPVQGLVRERPSRAAYSSRTNTARCQDRQSPHRLCGR